MIRRATVPSILLIIAFSLNILASRPLTFEERVKAQEAIEIVYYNHRTWPKDNAQPKPPFQLMVPRQDIQASVTGYLEKSAALEKFWQRPIEPGELQEEMNRMARESKDPAMLEQLFSALHNDPYLIAECLARPILADKLIGDLYPFEKRIHWETRSKAEDALIKLTAGEFCAPEGSRYCRIKFRRGSSRQEFENDINGTADLSVPLQETDYLDLFAEVPPEGGISGIRETVDSFNITRTVRKNSEIIEIETLCIEKISFEQWRERACAEDAAEEDDPRRNSFNRPALPPYRRGEDLHGRFLECAPPEGSWITISSGTNVPAGRQLHTAVWTGAEMIVWGGVNTVSLRTGGRYYPSTDSWLSTSTGANTPAARYYHTAVWTGTEMIIWGSGTNTGGRYNPSTNLWTLTSVGTNCPSARTMHSAVWTGTEMIIWGGSSGTVKFNSGARYFPSTNTWTPISSGTNVPSERSQHSAVWTGSEMIVWGGRVSDSSPYYTNTGGRYDAAADSWNPTSTLGPVPAARAYHTAVWSGTRMIVWGGMEATGNFPLFTGSMYTPDTDNWMSTSEGDFFPEARSEHTAVWNGTHMIIWGGSRATATLNSGGLFDPLMNSWIPTSTGAAVPSARSQHSAVWADNMMIVWGGFSRLSSGSIFLSSPVPPALPANNTATDAGGCLDSGVLIGWTAPLLWGDNATGTRTFDILRDGSPIVSGLSEATLSYTDESGDNEVSYLYQVKANNGCGLSVVTTGAPAEDHVSEMPAEVSSLHLCGWSEVPGATAYKLYRGTRADLPNLQNSTAEGCVKYEGPLRSIADCDKDDPRLVTGRFFWYLVTALDGTCEGSAGEGTGFTRNLSSTVNCSNDND